MMIDKIKIEDLEEEFRLMYGAKTPARGKPNLHLFGSDI